MNRNNDLTNFYNRLGQEEFSKIFKICWSLDINEFESNVNKEVPYKINDLEIFIDFDRYPNYRINFDKIYEYTKQRIYYNIKLKVKLHKEVKDYIIGEISAPKYHRNHSFLFIELDNFSKWNKSKPLRLSTCECYDTDPYSDSHIEIFPLTIDLFELV